MGGAVGDALGAPIEFDSYSAITAKYGQNGINCYVENPDGTGEFTDDTQMTLFTAEGLLRACHREVLRGIGADYVAVIYQAYLRWLHTQGLDFNRSIQPNISEKIINSGWLIEQKQLFRKRAPGNTCLNFLASGKMGTLENPINDSKGCGTVMRMAPVGLMFYSEYSMAFELGAALSAITHGHPTGILSGGFFASLLALLALGNDLENAITQCCTVLKKYPQHHETLQAVNSAVELYHTQKDSNAINGTTIEKLGAGWVAEEALAISLFCSLVYRNNFEKGVLLSVNHSGDSDSTGSMTGNILGLINGVSAIPAQWIDKLLYADIVRQVGEDLHTQNKSSTDDTDKEWWKKYPGF